MKTNYIIYNTMSYDEYLAKTLINLEDSDDGKYRKLRDEYYVSKISLCDLYVPKKFSILKTKTIIQSACCGCELSLIKSCLKFPEPIPIQFSGWVAFGNYENYKLTETSEDSTLWRDLRKLGFRTKRYIKRHRANGINTKLTQNRADILNAFGKSKWGKPKALICFVYGETTENGKIAKISQYDNKIMKLVEMFHSAKLPNYDDAEFAKILESFNEFKVSEEFAEYFTKYEGPVKYFKMNDDHYVVSIWSVDRSPYPIECMHAIAYVLANYENVMICEARSGYKYPNSEKNYCDLFTKVFSNLL